METVRIRHEYPEEDEGEFFWRDDLITTCPGPDNCEMYQEMGEEYCKHCVSKGLDYDIA